jgi:N-acetylglucosaminyl-diphospho-decaprenol L-rhamnosyltransferase
MPRYSVIIVAHNSGKDIAGCLQSLRMHFPAPAEVIVIANASSDDTIGVIARVSPPVTFIRNNVNIGFGAAVNRAVAAATGDVVVLMNPDTRILQPFGEELESLFSPDPDMALAGVRLVDEEGRIRRSVWRSPSLFMLLCESVLPYSLSIRVTAMAPRESGPVPMVSGACMAVRRDILRELGGFDERFFMYYEDADLCFRIRKAGYRIHYAVAGSVYHREGGSFSDHGIDSLPLLYRSKILFYRKLYSGTGRFAAGLMIGIGIGIKGIVHGLAGLISGSAWFRRSARAHWTLFRTLPVLFRTGGREHGVPPM